MHRFFVEEKEDNSFILTEQVIHHLKVARLFNEHFLVNYQNEFYECVYNSKTQKADIIDKVNINNEYQNDLILAAPIIKIDRFEWMLEKAVELGVKTIIPLISQYVNHKLIDSAFNDKKYIRYKTKLQNAAEQSFRNLIPKITNPQSFQEIITDFLAKDYKIYIAHEQLNSNYYVDNLQTKSVILVGPEGGFSQQEIEYLQSLKNSNIQFISLGKRILRAETAAITMLAKVKE